MKTALTFKRASPAGWSVKWHLHARLAGNEPARDPLIVHSSDLDPSQPDFCARSVVLRQQQVGGDRATRWVSTGQRVTFWLGNKLQQAIVEEWLPDMVVGDWVCRFCGNVYPFQKQPPHCTRCQRRHFRAVELRFTSRDSGVSSGTDCVVDFGLPLYRVLEIKSLDKDEFKKLAAPYAEHRWRTQLYLRNVAESDDPNAKRIATDYALILYVSKGTAGVKDSLIREEWGLSDAPLSPFKEFQVVRDDAANESRLQQPRELKRYREQGGEIPERICGSIQAKRARICPVAKQCFWGGAK